MRPDSLPARQPSLLAASCAAERAPLQRRTSSIRPLKGVPPLPRSPIFKGVLPSFGLRVEAREPSAEPLTKTRRVAPSQEPATCTHWPAGMVLAPVTELPLLQSSRVPNMSLFASVTRNT